jgi:hypothetical protein
MILAGVFLGNAVRPVQVLYFVLLCGSAHAAPIQFEDRSDRLGFTRGTETWGLAWGNINGDRYPDLYNQGHRDFPRIYINTGDGDFQDLAMVYDVAMGGYHLNDTQHDVHAGGLGDFDNDGDDDIMTGGENEAFINNADSGGFFTPTTIRSNRAFAMWNNLDGDRELESDRSCPSGHYLMLFDVDADGDMDRLCGDEGAFPAMDPTGLVPQINQSNDAALGDFNNDLRTDIVVTRGTLRPAGAARVNGNRIEAWFRTGSGAEFTFAAEGEVTYTIDGAGGGAFRQAEVLELDSNGTNSGSARGVSVSYDSAAALWRVRDTSNRQAYVRIDTANPASEPVMTGLETGDMALGTYHGQNEPGGFRWRFDSGLDVPKFCVSVVAADFDNDMDVDLYMACRQGVSNLANRYFDNQGDGTFVEVTAHGGEGPVGNGLEFGIADSVVAADYDVDGFVDLTVSNGLLFYPVSFGGPDTLLRNAGNSNHWIEIDLLGTISPNAAIGAKVYVTAGGVTQLREQSGSYHRFSQNHARLHFGLAGNTTVSEVRVEWPSGQVDVYNGIAADQLYEATEATAFLPVVLEPPTSSTVASGEECGEPPYTTTLGPAMQLWRDCGTDQWTVKVQGGLARLSPGITHQMAGTISADAGFSAPVPLSLNGADTLSGGGTTTLQFDINANADLGNNKGFTFSTQGLSSACMVLDATNIEVLYIGSAGKRIEPPYDLLGLASCQPDIDADNDGIPDSVETAADADGDGVANQNDLDSDNDTIADVIEAGLADLDGNSLVDVAALEGTVTAPPDTDSDGLPDYLDRESSNALNDGTAYDIAGTANAVFDSNGDGQLSVADDNAGTDADGDGIDDLVDPNPGQPGGGGNRVPSAAAQSLSTSVETAVSLTLTGSDPDGDSLQFAVGSGPANGTLSGTAPNLVYTPSAGFQGDDGFGFTVFDGLASSPPAQVSVSVLAADTDVFCGDPGLTNASPAGTYLWLDCAGGRVQWFLRVVGDLALARQDYAAQIDVIGGLANVTPQLVEGNDTIDTSDPNRLVYNLIVFGNARDGLDFEVPASACFVPSTPVGGAVFAGRDRTALVTDTISFDNGQACPEPVDTDGDGLTDAEEGALGTNPNLPDTDGGGADDGFEVANGLDPLDPSDDPQSTDLCGPIEFQASTEPGVYLWQDCGAGGADAQWQMRAVGGGLPWQGYFGSLIASAPLASTPFDQEPNDVFDTTPGDEVLDFGLFVGGNGVDGFEAMVPVSADTCFEMTAQPAGTSVFVGAQRMQPVGAFNLTDLGACQLVPPEPEAQCGEPAVNNASEPGLYLWQDCTVTGQRDWTVRVVGGGLSWQEYAGTLTADQVLNPVGFSLEGSDTLDSSPGDGVVDYSLFVGGSGRDGFDVTVPDTAVTCLVSTNLPAGAGIFVGEGKLLQSAPFNLEDLGACL